MKKRKLRYKIASVIGIGLHLFLLITVIVGGVVQERLFIFGEDWIGSILGLLFIMVIALFPAQMLIEAIEDLFKK